MASAAPLRKLAAWIRPEPLAAVILWGGIYPAAKVGLAEIPPLAFTYLRVVLAAGVLAAAARASRPVPASRGLRVALLGAGIAQAAFQLLLIAGLARTTAGTSAILLAASPLMTAGWLGLTARDRVPGRHWAALAVGLGGVALVVGGGSAGFDRPYLAGDLLALAAAGAWALYSLAIEPLAGALGGIRATGWAMGIAGVILTPFALAGTARLAWSTISPAAWSGLVYGATAGMVVAMTLWGRSMHALGPRQTMVYVYLEPVSAVLIAAALLGEALRPEQALGALLTFAGVWLASTGQTRR
ncbi:MAG TPA: DMT family transporter [bacterium]|nr:DMT family transporter [bacterium]